MSEIAIISARRARLQSKAGKGDERALVVLDLAGTPNRFLSTVQIGITLVGVFTGALGGATIAGPVSNWIGRLSWLAPYADAIAISLVVLVTTYLSLVIGELAPKRLALAHPERIAMVVARPMRALSRMSRPVVRLLSVSTDLMLRVMGVGPANEPPVTEDEIRILLQEGADAGVFDRVEQDMVERILLLDDRRAGGLMTPRPDIIWLDVDDPPEEIRRKIEESGFSRYPVAEGSLDNILGEVQAKHLLSRLLAGKALGVQAVLEQPLYVPEIMSLLGVLEAFRESHTQMALVIGEYGDLQGLITLNDILEAIVGGIPSVAESGGPEIIRREDGSWLVDGVLSIDEFKDRFDIGRLPGEDQGLYQSLAGFVTMQIGDIPSVADRFCCKDLCFEVVSIEGPRVDKVLIVPLELEGDAEAPGI